MKIRNGFVSNSSTSSFMIIGFDICKNEVAKRKLLEIAGGNEEVLRDDYNVSYRISKKCGIKDAIYRKGDSNNGLRDCEEILGILLADVSSDGGDFNCRFSMTELQTKLDILKVEFEITEELKMIAGTRCS